MYISIINIEEISDYENALNQHIGSVFEEVMKIEVNDEFLCAVIIEDDNQIIACGLGYTRKMSQGNVDFNSGIIGGIAVNESYQGLGLCKKIMQKLDTYMVSNEILFSFLFAYEPRAYLSSGYSNLLAPIHYFDKQFQTWNEFVFRGGMVKSYTRTQLSEAQVIEFKGCVY